VYGLSGALSFRIDDKDATLLPGESLFIKRGIVHSFGNQPKRPPPACPCSLRGGWG
jgi:quercetin dioxygenase-like cupin family protein